MRILVVEDDPSLANLLKILFELEDFTVDVCGSAEQAQQHLAANTPELIILDVNLPALSGFDLQRQIRDQGIPVIFLTARTHVDDRILGLKLGADDYVTKPFDNEELVLRVRALAKRLDRSNTRPAVADPRIQLSEEQRSLYVDGTKVDLTNSEFQLFRCLYGQRPDAVSRDTLLATMWEVGPDEVYSTRAVDVQIQRIRKKLGAHRDWIKTVYGLGYSLDTGSEETP